MLLIKGKDRAGTSPNLSVSRLEEEDGRKKAKFEEDN